MAGEQLARLALVTIAGDPVERELVGKGAPQRAAAALQPPTSLVDVECAAAPDPSSEIDVGPLERIAGAGQDLIDRAAADPGAEQFLAPLDAIAARDAVSDRQRRDRRL
jgi:hypothetical protein